MRALWSDRPNCSHNVSQKVKRIRRFSVNRGGENGVFGKRSFCWGDTRHFVIFVDFQGPRSKVPCFCGRNAISAFLNNFGPDSKFCVTGQVDLTV